jgi:hypothetical protein
MYKFILFVSWPEDRPSTGSAGAPEQVSETAARSSQAPPSDEYLTIAILGKSPFKDYFNEIDGSYLHEKNKQLAVTYLGPYREEIDLKRYEIVYISSSEKNRLAAILDDVRTAPVLTVSGIEGFAEAGGIIEFHTVGSRVRFAVNLQQAHAAGLTISSKMLRAATRVLSGPEIPTSQQEDDRLYTASAPLTFYIHDGCMHDN